MGTDSQGAAIGTYFLFAAGTSTVDGSTGKVLASNDGGINWRLMPDGGFAPHNLGEIYIQVAGPNDTPVPFTNASTPIEIQAMIQPMNTLDTSTDITIDGSATFELVYL
ncbi:hypothetical protein ACIQVE_01850 [Pseudomonas sp. NPDC098747]|uniref:hypothetical protein n=1 Tax=Pseudomonas sp. NPDC098747 TaxID=3364487 RepID=UPI00383B63D6